MAFVAKQFRRIEIQLYETLLINKLSIFTKFM